MDVFRKRHVDADKARVSEQEGRWTALRDILSRQERPLAKDQEQLTRLAAELNLPPKQVEIFAAVVAEHNRLQTVADDGAKSTDKADKIRARMKTLLDEFDPHRERYKTAMTLEHERLSNADAARTQGEQAAHACEILQAQFGEILTGKPAREDALRLKSHKANDAIQIALEGLGQKYP